MAGRKKGAPSQSAFIREKLASDSKMNLASVNEAWKKEHKGEITATLFYQVKSKTGVVKARKGTVRRGRPPKAAVMLGGSVGLESFHNSTLEGLERKLDELVTLSDSLGDSVLSAQLRTSRRLVSAKL